VKDKEVACCYHRLLDKIAWVLVVIGALNWGLVGLFHFDLVSFLLGSVPMIERIVYILVGLAGLYLVVFFCRCCMACKK
jgi:uncharacterized membrane protein YuzA (DUF378 family)